MSEKEKETKSKRTLFPYKKSEFLDKAKPIEIIIDGQKLLLTPKEFSTGSVGFGCNGKIVIGVVDLGPATYQLGINLTAIGSKEAEQ